MYGRDGIFGIFDYRTAAYKRGMKKENLYLSLHLMYGRDAVQEGFRVLYCGI